jgi:Kdo2-lipid IVA lauroyltransferase/acyltransferase
LSPREPNAKSPASRAEPPAATWVRLVMRLASLLPWRVRWWIARLGTTLTPRRPARVRVARANLDLAFGDAMPDAEKDRVARASLMSLAGCMLDAVSIIPRLRPENWSRYVKVPQADVDALHGELARGKGALVMFSHYGNWELMGACMSFMGFHPCNVVAKRQPGWSNALIEGLRTWTGNSVIYKEGAAMATLRALRRNEIVGLSIDQNFSQGIFVPFFGVLAGTPDTLAALARASGAPIVPLVCTPDGDGTYTGHFLPAIHADRTADKEADLVLTTRRCFEVLEKIIRERPSLWMWGHKRWKSRPPGEVPARDPYAPRSAARAASAR